MLNAASVGYDISLCHTQARLKLLDILLSEIRQVFPQISYELDANSRTANAQALSRGDVRVVRLYGGLALHPLIGADALIFALLHETGHLFAKGRRFARDPMLACECAADRWALTTGIGKWQRRFDRGFSIQAAAEQLGAVVASVRGEPLSIGKSPKGRTSGCWAASWETRMIRLCKDQYKHLAKRCYR
jgi:hypothetical protein